MLINAQSNPASPVIAITAGEPAGIGPDLCVLLAQEPQAENLVVIANAGLLAQRARQLGKQWHALPADAPRGDAYTPGAMAVIDVPLAAPVTAGQLDPANSAYVLHTLEAAVDGCLAGHFAAMVTAPVHKGVINDAGIAFTGHTEFLAARTRADSCGDDARRRRLARRARHDPPRRQGYCAADHRRQSASKRCASCSATSRAASAWRSRASRSRA